jgi:hypothetical protein
MPRQRCQTLDWALMAFFHSSLPVSASSAIRLLCGVQMNTLLPTCSGVSWSSAPLPSLMATSPVW